MANSPEISGFEALSPLLRGQLSDLIVDRRGRDDDSYMRTEDITGQVVPGAPYALVPGGLRPVPAETPDTPTPTPVEPPHALIQGAWHRDGARASGEASILGTLDDFVLPAGVERVAVPLVTARAEWVAFYDSRLLAHGDIVRFPADAELPVTITAVGATYVDGYLMRPELGGGTYLEVHDRPHFHMPVGEASGGGFLLGKPVGGDEYKVTAFRIPPGHGIVTGPGAIHNDAHLIGRFVVIYSLTPDFSTAILRRADGTLAAFDLVASSAEP